MGRLLAGRRAWFAAGTSGAIACRPTATPRRSGPTRTAIAPSGSTSGWPRSTGSEDSSGSSPSASRARPPKGTWSEHLAHLADLFEPYLDGHEPITGALTALARLDGLTAEISPDRFDRTVRSVIEGLTADDARSGRAGAFRARGINVVDVNSLRHMRFRAVCVVGLAERHFPPSPKEDPLLLDAERAHLNETTGWQLPLRAQGADPEPLQFGLALGAAQERLQLSYPRTEHGSGRPLYASGFLRSAAEALAGERIQAEDLDDVEAGVVRAPARRSRRRPATRRRARRRGLRPHARRAGSAPGDPGRLRRASRGGARSDRLAGPPVRSAAHGVSTAASPRRPRRPWPRIRSCPARCRPARSRATRSAG